MSRVNLAELRRLHEAANRPDCTGTEYNYFTRNVLDALPALLDELEAAREEVRRLQEIVTAPTYREGLALVAGKDARDRRTKLLGAAEELERLASVNQHRMLDCNDLTERAAQLRREAEDAN